WECQPNSFCSLCLSEWFTCYLSVSAKSGCSRGMFDAVILETIFQDSSIDSSLPPNFCTRLEMAELSREV
ncbi:MAG: hypothetical protein V7L13_13155, partial [Nostoc sp.]|uniref:hypothetical protein n=1 Tax=Nostoc sp. TaxID=1180 RepID=UPI002FF896E3